MRFASNSAPMLTPLGYRLLSLSERKLARLEPEIGGIDEGSLLRKGVVVRQAIKSAWQSIELGDVVEVTDWRSTSAMGLDVIGEDEEEVAENEDEDGSVEDLKQERWFEDLVSSLGEEDDERFESGGSDHDWAESHVSGSGDFDFEDLAYDPSETQAFTLPSPSTSSEAVLRSPPSPASSISSIESSMVSLASSVTSVITTTTIDVVEVEVDEVGDVDDEDIASVYSECDDCGDGYASTIGTTAVPAYVAHPHTPTLVASPRAFAPSSLLDISKKSEVIIHDIDELDCDTLELPPLLHRCYSDCSVSSLDEEECRTPLTGSCEDLEEEAEAGSALGWGELKRPKQRRSLALGLDLDIGTEACF